jgi:hypothetical protein
MQVTEAHQSLPLLFSKRDQIFYPSILSSILSFIPTVSLGILNSKFSRNPEILCLVTEPVLECCQPPIFCLAPLFLANGIMSTFNGNPKSRMALGMLSQELWDKAIAYSDEGDHAQLRLACKSFYAKATELAFSELSVCLQSKHSKVGSSIHHHTRNLWLTLL